MYLSKNIDKNVRDSYQGLTYPLSLIHLKDVNGFIQDKTTLYIFVKSKVKTEGTNTDN